MKLIPILLLFACINYLYLGFATYRLDRRSPVNRLLLLLCCAFALWSFTFAFMNSSQFREEALFWYVFSTIGWSLFSPVTLHLALLMTRNERYLNPITITLMYGTSAVSVVIIAFFLIGPDILTKVPGGWVPSYNISLWLMIAFITWYVLFMTIAGIVFYRWGRRSPFKREKKQVKIILSTSLVALSLGSISDNILPALNVQIVPLTAPIFGMIWMYGFWYAIKRYRLLNLNTTIAAKEIINTMRDHLIMTDYNGAVIQASPHTCEAMGRSEEEIRGVPIALLVAEQERLDDEIVRFRTTALASLSDEFKLKMKAGGSIPVRLSASALRDREGDLIGIVFVGYDLRETKKLLEMQRIADIEMEMASLVQSGIFPRNPPSVREWEIAVHFRPVTPVSGDFYDFYESNGRLDGVSLFDVSGHGVSAGLITMIASSAVRYIFRACHDVPLNEVMGLINEALGKEIGHVDNFLTGTLLRFGESGIEYANAAHTQLLCRRGNDGSVSMINRDDGDFRGPLLGIKEEGIFFEQITFSLAPGDQILLYSDALVETMNADRRHFGQDGLADSFRAAPVGSPQETVDCIVRDAERHMNGQPWKDDLTIILLKRSM
ncbi:MAG TPA: SpoIIE family protein phosphatase [Spirochaetota bacterium]|nr:SpoIIE family protein phosphatase [Spirochaetota bacterium]HOD16394.1 SpoIIE family protein phosphatase [Spirochaetota bacterium]HPG49973.1 SpoIIE family protein phosphatase [Spirochaetota bacterium]HPN12850.1 SpoIIE family protein phosphatase [Spirochaetota bacterium]